MKNRFDGEVGQAGLAFNKDTRRYLELNKIERDLFVKEEGDVKKLLERRMSTFNTIEPFLDEQKRQKKENDNDDKRRLMMKDKVEMARQMNLSKMVRQVSSDLDMYSSVNKKKS